MDQQDTNEPWPPVPYSLSTAVEDARLDAFFLHVGAAPQASAIVSGTRSRIQKGSTARQEWTLNNRAGGGSEAFLRAHWIDAARAIISFGYTDGEGYTEFWKALFSEEDQVQRAVFVCRVRSSSPITAEEALGLWVHGEELLQ